MPVTCLFLFFQLSFRSLIGFSLTGLTNLEYLNLDSCKIGDEGLANLTGLLLGFAFFLFVDLNGRYTFSMFLQCKSKVRLPIIDRKWVQPFLDLAIV